MSSPATIQILAPSIRRQIAAGEVIDRPASAAKELIENAIDAGAQAISIEVRDGGLSMIRADDDGRGMSRTDAPLSLARFSTSKVHSMHDLETIQTLGFRGEALSSIAAVAQVEILTRTAQETEGTRVRAFGDQIEIEPAASPMGTSVTVRALFGHLPARRRFLKSHIREAELIQRTVTHFALAYPQIAFRLIVDGRERLTAPAATPLARIGAVLGRDVAGEMIAIEWHAVDMHIHGYISRPTIGRSRRDGQHFFVNGRPIRAGLMAVMLERPYTGRLPPGRHPLGVICVELDPHYVDVNVHPQKAEVRFAHERSVYGAISSAVANALHAYPQNVGKTDTPWPFAGLAANEQNILREPPADYVTHVRALAQLHSTYILAQTPDGLAIADQHAAHEQVLFERLESSSSRRELSPPAQIHLTPGEIAVLERIAPLLADLGIEIEPFGGQTFMIRTLPAALQPQDPSELVTALLEEAKRYTGSEEGQRTQLALKAACLCAVKAGDPLTLEQMQRMLEELTQTWSPATCPHGRPALVSISMEELARRFNR